MRSRLSVPIVCWTVNPRVAAYDLTSSGMKFVPIPLPPIQLVVPRFPSGARGLPMNSGLIVGAVGQFVLTQSNRLLSIVINPKTGDSTMYFLPS